jgi:hypothetical protein
MKRPVDEPASMMLKLSSRSNFLELFPFYTPPAASTNVCTAAKT